MSKAKLAVFETKFTKGWNGDPDTLADVDTWPISDASSALLTEWSTDAHFVPYYVEDETAMPRLNQKALEALRKQGKRVLFDMVVIDVDCPEAHKGEKEASAQWRRDQLHVLRKLPWWDTAGFYETRGGYRLLWDLKESLEPENYISLLGAFVAELKTYGILADELTDWNRVYRLPSVVRDGQPQEVEVDIEDMAALDWEPSVELSGTFSGIEKTKTPLVVPDKIGVHKRNILLTRIAGKYRRMGMNQEEMVAALSVINESRCDPPVDDDELYGIAKSMCRYEPPPSSQGENLGGPMFQLGSDTEIAEAACDKLEDPDGPPLVFDRSELWQYVGDQGVWEMFPLELVRNVIDTFDGERIASGRDRNGDPKTVPLKVGHRLCVNVVSRICDRRYHKGFFDTAKTGLTFNNCFVYIDEDGIQTEEFSPSQRATARLDFDYIHNLEPSRFVKALKSCFKDDPDWQDKIRVIQQFVGTCLLGSATKLQKGMIFLGTGANGKSTVQEVIAALFSHGQSTKIISAIPPQDMEQEYRRAMLSKSRLNVVNELPEADILASESVKAMISGDLMTGRHIRQAPFEFIPKAGHLFAANSLPGVRDMSLGFWRRWIVIPFTRTFARKEQIPGLSDNIIQNEMMAVASWALRGAADALQNGYAIPQSSKEALDKWRTDADQVASFLEHFALEKAAEEKNSAAKIYNAYCLWASNFGHRHLSGVKFYQRLSSLGVEKKRTKTGVFYVIPQKTGGIAEIH